MSDNFLRLVPVLPEYVPSADALERALAVLRALVPNATAVQAELKDEVRFVDPGSNLERISCPGCGSQVSSEVWKSWMDSAYQHGFADRSVRPGCCGAQTDLDSLVYEWPAGFSRLVLEVRNPGIGGGLTDSAKRSLEHILGCELRQVLARI